MATVVRMPEVLANATEAVISTWETAEGATVAVGDLLAEIETEKAVVELTAEQAGVLARHLVAAGERVEVGAPIALLLDHADEQVDLAALLGQEADLAAQAEQPADAPAQVARVTEAARGTETAVASAPVASGGGETATADADAVRAGDAPAQTDPGARQFLSPLARRMAREQGVDLTGVRGSGPGGRVVRRDVERLVAARDEASVTTSAAATAPDVSGATRPVASGASSHTQSATHEDVPHTPMRRAIARRLTQSKQTVPHFYLAADCRVDALLALRAEINATGSVRVSVNDLVLKAVAAAYREVPEANVVWTEDALRRFTTVDVSVAVSTGTGLVTPVVRGVGELTLSALSRAMADLVERARAGRLRQDELEGGSITVSNLGMYGTREFSAILNPPQAAILAVGAAIEQPVVTDGALGVGTVMRCTMSADHRALDGALAARWLAAFQGAVERPVSLLV